MKLPKHMYLRIVHNAHASNYEPLEQWLQHQIWSATSDGSPQDDFVSPADLAAIRATGEVWEVYWCPDTPVGSCSVIAATLERALELAADGE